MDASSNGLGKLLPKSIKEKRRRKKEASLAETTSSTDDVVQHGQQQQQQSQPESPSRRGFGRRTTESDTSGAGDDNSLISYDSDPDYDSRGRISSSAPSTDESYPSPASRPSAISTHPSQIGYLTTNSPLVQVAHQPEPQITEHPPTDSSPALPDFLRERTDSASSDPTRAGLAPPQSLSSRRSTSATRLRDAFRFKRPVSSAGSASPERNSEVSANRSSQTSLLAQAAQAAQIEPQADLAPQEQEPPAKKLSTLRGRRFSRGQKVDTSKPPRTPPSGDAAPVIVNTPPTPTDSSHPTFRASDEVQYTTANASPPGPLTSPRRRRAGSDTLGPSKLSNIISAPLTPPLENVSTPSGTSTPNFFSSMLSAVQNTANSISNTISTTNLSPGNKIKEKDRSNSQESIPSAEDTVEVETTPEATQEEYMDSQEPAVKSLGMGDLSLSQLGIVDSGSNVPTPITAKFDKDESRHRSDSAPADVSQVTGDNFSEEYHRPKSLYDSAPYGDQTSPSQSVYEGKKDKSDLQRSSSIRSAIGRRRKRGSSAATGGTNTTIGAAIVAANASVARPTAQAGAPKLTGFAVATKKRNRDFHVLFKSVPDDDYLIEDYSCALQREILAHGRLYVSEGHLCFNSNILGWVTTLVMSFDEIVSVEKRSTALVFKNGLEISTLHAKHIFASFASRDTTYDLIVKIWKMSHPNIKSSLNGVQLEETGGDRTEKVETESISVGGSHSASGSDVDSADDDDDVYDEDEEIDDSLDNTQTTEPITLDAPAEKTVARKPSGAVTTNGAADSQNESTSPGATQDFPGPTAHSPTECGDVAQHYDKTMGDDIIPAPLGKVYTMLFGPQSPTWLGRWITENQKCTELQMEDKRGLTEEVRTRTYTYIKPLYAPIGPKQTKCIVTETLETFDLEKAVSIMCSTQTPDVPSGNVFSVKTRYCLSWAENNSTRVQMTCTVEWTGKSWLKGPIEKGANDGQSQYAKDIFASLKAAMSSRARSGAATAAAKGKKKGRKGKAAASTSAPTSDGEVGAAKKPASLRKAHWGPLEPARPLLGPLVDTVRPLVTGNLVYGLLVGLLVTTWFGFGSSGPRVGDQLAHVAISYPQRLAAYEEMWRREESELWDWLEERVSLERLGRQWEPASSSAGAAAGGRKQQKRGAVADQQRAVLDKLREDRMDEREVREAIRVTEDRLRVLKDVVEKAREGKEGGR